MLWQVFQPYRFMLGHPVLSKNLSEILFLVFFTYFAFLSKKQPRKSLSRETCLDLELRNKKLVCQSVLFFIDRLARPAARYLLKGKNAEYCSSWESRGRSPCGRCCRPGRFLLLPPFCDFGKARRIGNHPDRPNFRPFRELKATFVSALRNERWVTSGWNEMYLTSDSEKSLLELLVELKLVLEFLDVLDELLSRIRFFRNSISTI